MKRKSEGRRRSFTWVPYSLTAEWRSTPPRAYTVEQRRKIVDGNEGSKRIGDVGIDAGPAMQNKSPEGTLRIEIGEVERAQESVGGQKEIEGDQRPAGTGDALDLAHGDVEIGEIAQAVADENAVE